MSEEPIAMIRSITEIAIYKYGRSEIVKSFNIPITAKATKKTKAPIAKPLNAGVCEL